MPDSLCCPVCQTALPADTPAGFCPVCEFRGALDSAGAIGRPLEDENCPDSAADVTTVAALTQIRFFGDYELLEEIGRGGMGVVFKARQISLNRRVALKMILAGPLASRSFVERFRTEAEAAARLDHPNIVPIYETGEQAGQHYLVMKLVEGSSLAEKLASGAWPGIVTSVATARQVPGVASSLLVKVALAVHYAHQRGVLHRDLKPGNILLDANGEPYVADFGLAKILENDRSLTLSHAMLGTASYMAPEQAVGDAKQLTTAADVYSLGAILYELLTGQPPFAADTPIETIRQVIEKAPRKPNASNPLVDRDLDTVCLKCLEKEPKARYGSAQALAEDLQRWLRHEPILARSTSTFSRVRKWALRKPALASLAVALTAVFALGAAGVLWQWWRAEHQNLQSEQNLYAAQIQVASRELEDRNLVRARQRLQRIAQSPTQNKMRGWEWRYLMGQCRSEEVSILGRHDSRIWDLAVSPHGRWVATISDDGVAKLWDVAGRREANSWQAHAKSRARKLRDSPRFSIAFSHDSRLLATGGADGKVRLWNLPSLEATPPLPEGFNDSCTAIAFSNDGQLLAALDLGGNVNLWTMSDGRATFLRTWNTDLKSLARGLAFSPDGTSLIAGALQKAPVMWRVSERAFRNLHPFSGIASPAVISPDGRFLVARASDQYGLKKWNLETLQEEEGWRGREARIERLAISDDNGLLAAGFRDGTIMLWDMTGAYEPRTLMGHEASVRALAFLREEPLLVSASEDQTVRLWDVSVQEPAAQMMRHGISVLSVAFSRDCRYLASVAREITDASANSPVEKHTVKLWEASTGTELVHAIVGGRELAGDVAFSRDDQYLTADDFEDTLRLYTVPDLREVTLDFGGVNKETGALAGHCAVFLPDGRTMVYASAKRILRRGAPWAPEIGESTIGQLEGKIIRLAVCPDGRTVAANSDGDDGVTIHLWDVRGNRLLGSLEGHTRRVGRLAFSPDGQTLASAGWDDKLGLWDVADRGQGELLAGHYGRIYGVAFSPDGKTLATCGEDALRLWNLASRQQVVVLPTHTLAYDVAFSRDGRWLAAGLDGGAIRIWEAPTLEKLGAVENRSAASP